MTSGFRSISSFRRRALDALARGPGRVVLGRQELGDLLDEIGRLEEQLLDSPIPGELSDSIMRLADALMSGRTERLRSAASDVVVTWRRLREERPERSAPSEQPATLDGGRFG